MSELAKIPIQGLVDVALEEARAAVASHMWEWFHTHANDTLISIHWWIFSDTERVSALENIFADLFGPDPTTTAAPPAPLPPAPVPTPAPAPASPTSGTS